MAQYQLGKILCSKGKHQEAVDIYVPLQMELINNDGDQNFKLNVYESIGTCYGDLKKSVKSLEYLFLVAGELEKMPTSKKMMID